jgi:DNA end-binding protein Ku
MLDKRDFSPIGYERVNKKTGEEVAWKDIVKGYEHAKGKYVVVTENDFEQANVEATRQLDIVAFVDFTEIDPRYFNRPYYLSPQKKVGAKAYALLREALQRTNKAGIGKIVFHGRQHLAAVTALEQSLILVLLRFADELRDAADLELPSKSLKVLGVSTKEVTMAQKLIEGMAEPFAPEKFKDEYRSDLLKLIRTKAKAGEINTVPEAAPKKRREPVGANVIDLAALLAQSVAGSKKAKKRSTSGPTVRGKQERQRKSA